VVRYTISGVGLVIFYSSLYWTAAVPLRIAPLVANTIAFAATLVTGWIIHSRWSFRGHGPETRPRTAYAKFLIVNLAGYALNSFWVWLIVERLGQSVGLSILPIAFVTPAASFWLNRRWTFA
jgi:putative flippase GtrA